MLRIVKMTFREDEIQAFFKIFSEIKPKIEAFPGCSKVDLVQDIHDPKVIMTHSIWTGPEALEAYRSSELFKSTWVRTKPLFEERAMAWSVEKIA